MNEITKLLNSQKSSEILGGLYLIPKLLEFSPDNLKSLVSQIPWDFLHKQNPDLYILILQKFTIANTGIFLLKFKEFQTFSQDLSNDFLILQEEFTPSQVQEIVNYILDILLDLKISVEEKMILFFLISQILQNNSQKQNSLVNDKFDPIKTVYFLMQIAGSNLDFLLERNLLSKSTNTAQNKNYIDLLVILLEQLLNVLISIGENDQMSDKDLEILLKIREFLKDYFKGIIEKICDYSADKNLQGEDDFSQVGSVVELICFWMEEEGIELEDLPEFKAVVDKL
jgi:hypothetical protein